MSKHRVIGIVAWIGMLAGAGVSLALTGEITQDPAELVKKYVQLDYKGARLDAASQQVLHPYIEWRDEPAWGSVVVVDDYAVLEHTKDWQILSMVEVYIPVDYQVLGTLYWDTAAFLPDVGVERIRFHVEGTSMRWKIVAPQIPPHVGVSRMINFVRHAILQETDDERVAKLTALRAALEQAR